MPKFDDVTVQLTGKDGNVFAVLGEVSRGLKKAGYKDEAKAFMNEVFGQESYDDVLRLCMETVNVE